MRKKERRKERERERRGRGRERREERERKSEKIVCGEKKKILHEKDSKGVNTAPNL